MAGLPQGNALVLAALVTTAGAIAVAVLTKQSASPSAPTYPAAPSSPAESQPEATAVGSPAARAREHVAMLGPRAEEISRELRRQKRMKESVLFLNLHRQNLEWLRQGGFRQSRALSTRINEMLAGTGLSYPEFQP